MSKRYSSVVLGQIQLKFAHTVQDHGTIETCIQSLKILIFKHLAHIWIFENKFQFFIDVFGQIEWK